MSKVETKLKKITIADKARTMSFEAIYDDMSKKRLELDIINKDISELEGKANKLRSAIGHLNQIALSKRRQLVNKGTWSPIP